MCDPVSFRSFFCTRAHVCFLLFDVSTFLQYAEAILCLAVGSVYLLLGFACRTMADPGFGGKPMEHSKYGEPGKPKEGTDPVKDLKKKAAHAAVDFFEGR